MDRYEVLKTLNRRHVWHPFTQMSEWLAEEPLIIERGEGNYLIDVRGDRYLDGVSSLWCNVHGHRKAELDAALKAQADRVAHSTMLGLANEPATTLAGELVSVAPPDLNRVFYADSGAEAVEVAARLAVQYWQLAGAPGRQRFLTLTESYHGDTVGSVSLGFSEPFHRHIRSMLIPALKTAPPHVYRFYRGEPGPEAEASAIAEARRIIDEHGAEVAALIVEPLMQGAAGMWNHSADYLCALTEMARAAGALVIYDEVATGFGRTGRLFACEHAGVAPDLLCLGKGITGGYLPLAATLATERVFEAFLGKADEFRAFYYGHTYTGNPLAAAVAIANLKLFRDERIIERIAPRIGELRAMLEDRFKNLPHVADIRQLGLMAGVELMRDAGRRIPYEVRERIGVRVAKAARKRGVIIRPLGDIIVFMPPLSISASELETLAAVTRDSICEATTNT